MIILTVRTDNPQAEIGLYDGTTQIAYDSWQAHRQLAETIHQHLQALLQENRKEWSDISGVVVYEGPGSFTGLRIGISTANALAYGLSVPIVAVTGNWIEQGIARLQAGEMNRAALPAYGAAAHITKPKK